MYKRTALALLAAVSASCAIAQASSSTFQLLSPGDAPQGTCGTYVHAKGEEPGLGTTRLFMTTDQVLYLRTERAGVRQLGLEDIKQTLRDKNVLGRGDTLRLEFRGERSERAVLSATVTESVVDDEGDYPLIAFDIRASYTAPDGRKADDRQLAAHDTCL